MTGLTEAISEARKTLELCDVLSAPAGGVREKWQRVLVALERAQRIEAAAQVVVAALTPAQRTWLNAEFSAKCDALERAVAS